MYKSYDLKSNYVRLRISPDFAREDYVEEAWRIVDPALKAGTPLYEYDPKTWGPVEADRVTPPGGWQNPVVVGN